jgi:hypothetical protein
MALKHLPGKSIEDLMKDHGKDEIFLFRNGELFAVLPSYQEFCDNIKNGNTDYVSKIALETYAKKSGVTVLLLSRVILNHQKKFKDLFLKMGPLIKKLFTVI